MDRTPTNIDLIKSLIQKYYDGATTPSELQLLLKIAHEPHISADSSTISEDATLDYLEDLKIIATLEDYGNAIRISSALSTPPGLEERLSLHISNLANSSETNSPETKYIHKINKRNLKKKFVFLISSAAAVALFLSIGIRLFVPSTNQTDYSFKTDSSMTSMEDSSPAVNYHDAAASETNNSDNNNNIMASAYKSADKAKKASKQKTVSRNPAFKHISSASKPTAAIVKPTGIDPVKLTSDEYPQPVLTHKIILPDLSEPILEVAPVLVQASVNPSQLVIQPLSTLCQAMDNVYESFNTVSKALTGANEVLESLSEGLSPLQDLSLRSI